MRSDPPPIPAMPASTQPMSTGSVYVERAVIDVSEYPTVVFGPRSTMWWGIICFILIEGTTLALCAASYLYVRDNFSAWPPEGTPFPGRTIPTINVIVLLVSLLPAYMAAQAGRHLDLPAMRRGLVLLGLFGIVTLLLRVYEFAALRTRWDSNAYGSVAWLVVFAHTTLLLVDVGDTLVFTAVASSSHMEKKHFSDSVDNSTYWAFTVLSWLPLYLLVYWYPRWT